jgi:hypothetical protein
MREANVRIIDQLLLYAYMILISHGYDTAINSLLTDKPHSMETPTWTLKIITKYFAMKHESKPRDYGPKKQNSSSNKQDSSSKKQEKKQESTSNTEADSHDGQQKRQKKHQCRHCNKWHIGTCRTIMNKNPNPSKPTPSNTTDTIELAVENRAGTGYYTKAAIEKSQHTWHIDSGASYTTTPNKA